jgi:hypothetical protein
MILLALMYLWNEVDSTQDSVKCLGPWIVGFHSEGEKIVAWSRRIEIIPRA